MAGAEARSASHTGLSETLPIMCNIWRQERGKCSIFVLLPCMSALFLAVFLAGRIRLDLYLAEFALSK